VGGVLLIGANSDKIDACRWRVIEHVSPDVAVVEAGPEDLDEIADLGRLAFCRLPDQYVRVVGDATLMAELDDDALQFMAAWRAQAIAPLAP
jgi:hypothetical protein